jgi:sugar/nucleoside kinase (ribokinase family)
MGARTAIISKIGADDFGLLNKTRLKNDGVDISHIIETRDNSTGVAFVTYFSNGSRKFIFHFTHAACGELCPQDIDEDLIKNTKFLHINGCSITGSPSMGEAIMKAVTLAIKHKVKVSFDPNIRPELFKGRIMDFYNEIIAAADILLTGRSELAFLYQEPEPVLIRLLDEKDRIVVIKDGGKSTSVYTRHECFKIEAFPAVTVDATGAGDSFDGTFLALLCQGVDIRTAAVYGNAAGAIAVSRRGPMEGNCGKAELDQLIMENPHIVPEDISPKAHRQRRSDMICCGK